MPHLSNIADVSLGTSSPSPHHHHHQHHLEFQADVLRASLTSSHFRTEVTYGLNSVHLVKITL